VGCAGVCGACTCPSLSPAPRIAWQGWKEGDPENKLIKTKYHYYDEVRIRPRALHVYHTPEYGESRETPHRCA
jgi:uncharacterized protein involved in tolerance to divalent cations